MKEFFCFLFKRDDNLLIKGLSFDKLNWYVIPKDKRLVKFHPMLTKYFNVEKCMKQKSVNRHPAIRITKEIGALYIDGDAFVFDGKQLEKDNHLLENSIYNQIQIQENQSKGDQLSNKREYQSNTVLNSTINKKPKMFNVSDANSLIEMIISEVGKFKLFEHQPEIYLNRIGNLLRDQIVDEQDSIDIVNSFFGLLEPNLHQWFFKDIYKTNKNYSDFKLEFVEAIQYKVYQSVRSISYDINTFLKSIEESKNSETNPLKLYFDSKIKILRQIFQMEESNARLMALCFLDFDAYEMFVPLIKDDIAFDSLVKLKNHSPDLSQIIKEVNVGDKNAEYNDEDDQNEHLKSKIDSLQKDNNDLQLANNNLSDKILELQKKIDAFKETDVSEYQEEIKRLKKDNDISKSSLSKAHETVSDYKEEIKILKKEKANDSKLISILQKELDNYKNSETRKVVNSDHLGD